MNQLNNLTKLVLSKKGKLALGVVMSLGVMFLGVLYLPWILWDLQASPGKCFEVEVKTPLKIREECSNIEDDTELEDQLDREWDEFQGKDESNMDFEERHIHKNYSKNDVKDMVLSLNKFRRKLCTYRSSVATITRYNAKCGKDVVIPKKIKGSEVVGIGDEAFRDKGLLSVKMPNTILIVGENAFNKNELTSVMFSDQLMLIEGSAFASNNLESISLPSQLLGIGDSAFSNNMLKKVILPDSVMDIWKYAFSKNEISNIRIPRYLRTLEKGVFYQNKLERLAIPSTISMIKKDAFVKNDIKKVQLPEDINTDADEGFDKGVAIEITD